VALKRADYINGLTKALREQVLEVSTVRTDTSSKSLSDRQDRLLNVLLWQAIPNLLQCDTQFCNGRWLWLQLLVCAQHDSPDVKVEWVEIGGSATRPWQGTLDSAAAGTAASDALCVLGRRLAGTQSHCAASCDNRPTIRATDSGHNTWR